MYICGVLFCDKGNALYIKIYDGAGGVLYIITVLFSNVCIVLLH